MFDLIHTILARRDSVNAEEKFRIVFLPGGGFALKSEASSKFVRADATNAGRLVADRLDTNDAETFKMLHSVRKR